MSKVEKQISRILTDEEKLMLSKHTFLQQRLEEEVVLQGFIYGFCMGTKLKQEVNDTLDNIEKHEVDDRDIKENKI